MTRHALAICQHSVAMACSPVQISLLLLIMCFQCRACAPVSTPANHSKVQKVFADNCAACRSTEGGAIRSLERQTSTWVSGCLGLSVKPPSMASGRGSVMPAWEGRLDDTTIKALTIFVHLVGEANR